MVLAEKHRTAIYTALSPVVGEEAIGALLSQFPARDVDEPVTRDFLDRRLAELETWLDGKLTAAFGAHREETRQQFFWLLGIQVGMLVTLAVGALSALSAAGG